MLLSPNACSGSFIPMQRLFRLWQRCVRDFADADALGPGGRANRDIAGIAAGSALELRIPDLNQAAGRRHLVEIGDALGLDIAVVHQPGLACERRRGVGVQRLVAVHQDVPLQVQELQCVQGHTGKGRPGRERGIGPVLGPVGADEDDGSGGKRAMVALEGLDVGGLQVIAGIPPDLLDDRNYDEWPYGEGWWQLVYRGGLPGPGARRIELGSELAGAW